MKFVTTAQARANYGLTLRIQQDLRAKRQIPFHVIGHRTILYRETDIENFLAARRIAPADMKPRRIQR